MLQVWHPQTLHHDDAIGVRATDKSHKRDIGSIRAVWRTNEGRDAKRDTFSGYVS